MKNYLRGLLGCIATLAVCLGSTVGLHKFGGWLMPFFGWTPQPIASGPTNWFVGLMAAGIPVLGAIIGMNSDWTERLIESFQRRLPKRPPALDELTKRTEKAGANRAAEFLERR